MKGKMMLFYISFLRMFRFLEGFAKLLTNLSFIIYRNHKEQVYLFEIMTAIKENMWVSIVDYFVVMLLLYWNRRKHKSCMNHFINLKFEIAVLFGTFIASVTKLLLKCIEMKDVYLLFFEVVITFITLIERTCISSVEKLLVDNNEFYCTV